MRDFQRRPVQKSENTRRSNAEPTPLARVRCDFCGEAFGPPRWNCRTCHRCAAAGSPDQSILPWREYLAALREKQRERGRMKLRGRPLQSRSLPAKSPQDGRSSPDEGQRPASGGEPAHRTTSKQHENVASTPHDQGVGARGGVRHGI